MSKIMSVLEKIRVVEKVAEGTPEEVKKVSTKTNNNDVLEPVKEEIKTPEPNKKPDNKQAQDNSKFEKNMTIEEIYDAYNLENSNVNTVFMLGNFINALPENLPNDVKKHSIMNIISASNVNLNLLLSDGENRLELLNQFANEYSNTTNVAIQKNNEEIVKLKQLIHYYEEQIQLKESMLEEQNNVIKYETQKINNIINFFKGD